MICIFQHIDANLDYEYILKSFLEKEHVDSEQEWVELYCEINGTPEECAYQILSKELTKYILIKEIDNDIYLKSIKENLGDTSCLCMTRDEVFYEKSFAKNIENEFSKIMRIDYEKDDGYLFVTGVKKSGCVDVSIFLTITEHADSVAATFLPMRKNEVSEKEFEKKQKVMSIIWNDKTVRIPFMEKVGVTLKIVDVDNEEN